MFSQNQRFCTSKQQNPAFIFLQLILLRFPTISVCKMNKQTSRCSHRDLSRRIQGQTSPSEYSHIASMKVFREIPLISPEVDIYSVTADQSISPDLTASSSMALFFASFTTLSLIPGTTSSPSNESCRNCSSGALFFAVRQRTQKQCHTSAFYTQPDEQD